MAHYTTNPLKIAFETFETEVVLVNLDSGHYYVLAGTAGTIWRLLMAGLSPAQVGEALTQAYTSSAPEMAEAAQGFADDLVEDGVLIEVATPEASRDATILDELQKAKTKSFFEAPSLFKYTDMEHLIQMDPIREVDESGWPERRKFPKKGA